MKIINRFIPIRKKNQFCKNFKKKKKQIFQIQMNKKKKNVCTFHDESVIVSCNTRNVNFSRI